ncbi:hypothetical protein CLAFUW4_07432 [Fulvia fulva]|uniref:Ricin B lectin domain-containing protein n=1 Tax=Passalora fulva TaxID=5499 RepID=A0A9Q8PB56_PASFU|nr:uncharacterized protein CLAFUR5_07562 [Fulvia fulva]KAK4621742.1 hypothetical protein CLAFUR4_07439 [Fulvia fulva]KAK4623158.1 hypothetical protein CLAFUR0_07438 [Fulvia fulva]UJO19259.1 hypothetical protein CLAFUR5_07562 [Fulvia fulva]WPV16102.1 hypothetical protein CLAFUW4_07432 [Fulvia fulva]WPV31467.1 hypothetical protein CLAFUW7_07435 [Fulvia fulva]
MISTVGSGEVIDAGNSSSMLQLSTEVSSKTQLWEFLPAPGGWLKIRNVGSGQLMMVSSASQDAGATVEQDEDYGDDGQLWRVQDMEGSGQFLIRNKATDVVASVDGQMVVQQAALNGSTSQLWKLLASVPPP